MKKIKNVIRDYWEIILLGSVAEIILFYLLMCLTYQALNTHTYSLTTIVINVSKATDKVTCQDFNGNLWQFKGVEDWCENDIATLTMSDNATELIEDDEIIDVKYGGYFEGWLENYEEIIILESEDSL